MGLKNSFYIVAFVLLWGDIVFGATVFYDFEISWIYANPDGVAREILGINGKFPAPTIELNLGDTLIVNVTNVDVVNGTGLHWHGMYQRGTPFMDGTSWVTQCPIAPGSTFQYKFTVNQTGTYWYHGHTLTNYVDGLYGALIIHDPNEPYASEYDDEVVLLVGDWHHQLGFNLLATFMSPHNPSGEEPTPNSVLFNGVGQADCKNLNPPIITEDSASDEDDADISATGNFKIKSCQSNIPPTTIPVTSGRTTRIRIINTSAFTRFIIQIDGHNQTIIEADGTPTEKITVDKLLIDVAQRYSVLLHADQSPGNYKLTASADPNLEFTLSGVALLQYPNVTGTQTVSVAAIQNPSLLHPFDLRPLQANAAPENVIQTILLTMDFVDDSNDINMATINNSTYMPSAHPPIYLAASNQSLPRMSNEYLIATSGVVEIVLNNRDDGQHPFHLHGHKFAVIGLGNSGDGDYNPSNQTQEQALNLINPMWRDTITVQDNSYLMIRVIADNPGTWLMHCHIEWHMEAGLAILLNELPSQLPAETISIVPSVCLSPVAPPNMDDPKTYGGVYLGSASTVASHAALVAVFALSCILLM